MTTATVTVGTTWTLITTAATFLAQNRSSQAIEVARAGSLPAESVQGVLLETNLVIEDGQGSGNLYAKGSGSMVLLT